MPCLKPLMVLNPAKSCGFPANSPYYKPEFGEFNFLTGKQDAFSWVPCRRCYGCAKDKQRMWRQRIVDEHSVPYKDRGVSCKYMLFVTFTIKDECMDFVENYPKQAFRKFFEAYRARYGHSCRHFVISERAPETGRLHFHGVLFLGDAVIDFERKIKREGLKIRSLCKELDKGDEGRLTRTQRYAFSEEIEQLWEYGWVDVGYNSSGRAASYCSKYITKNFGQSSVILVSPGFGRGWLEQNKKRLIAEGRRKAVHDYTIFGKFLCKYYRDKVFDGWWRQSDEIEFRTSSIPPPDVVWRRNPLSERFSDPWEYKRYVASLGSDVCPPDSHTLLIREFTERLDRIIRSGQTGFELMEQEKLNTEKLCLLSKKQHSERRNARITRFLTSW